MLNRLHVALLAVSLVGCAPKADLDKASAEIARLNAEVSQLNRLNEEQRAKLTLLEEQVARKPLLPVTVRLRPALLGTGHVAVFNTTIKQDFPILVTVKSKSLGTSTQRRVNLSAASATELGRSEGFFVEPEDELVLENQRYETSRLSFSSR